MAHPAAAPDSCSYLLFVPDGYPAMPRQEWPLVIYLHRAGSLGDDLDLVKLWGLPKALASHPGTPFFVFSPQAKGSLQIGGRWKTERIERLLADLRGIYRIDTSRIYPTGWSIGGNETWRWAVKQPHLFAAAVPIGGHGNLNRDADLLTVCALKDMPLSAFDGDHAARQSNQSRRGSLPMSRGRTAASPDHPARDRPSRRRSGLSSPALWLRMLERRRSTVPSLVRSFSQPKRRRAGWNDALSNSHLRRLL